MADAVKPITTFTRQHPQTGETQTRTAYSPAEVVNLTADGWVEKPSSKSASNSPAGGPGGSKPPTNN